MIKDSGERTEFGTGAVRDMHSGKGRMDLLPWEALIEVSKHCEEGALKYGERNCEKGIPIHSLIDSAFRHLAKYMMGMKDEPHLRAAAWPAPTCHSDDPVESCQNGVPTIDFQVYAGMISSIPSSIRR